MSNSKTVPPARKPQEHNGWVRKHELDDYLDRHLPIPTQVVSNEEFIPLPQTRKQRAVENELLEMGSRISKQLAETEARIFGLNAARLYGVDPKAKRNPVPADYVDRLRKQYKEAGNPTPSNTQYGWVRV